MITTGQVLVAQPDACGVYDISSLPPRPAFTEDRSRSSAWPRKARGLVVHAAGCPAAEHPLFRCSCRCMPVNYEVPG